MTKKKILAVSVAVLVLATGAYITYWLIGHNERSSPAHPDALEALNPTPDVNVTQDNWYVFSPAGASPTSGFIFYPGGECDERGYAELMAGIAAQGYLVVLVPMPLQLAVFAPNKAEAVMAAFPNITTWAIGGHSLGGAMAARFVFNHPDTMDGLLFWDAYPPDTDDLSQRKLAVGLIHRADSNGEPPDYYTQYFPLLPENTRKMALPGATHINFGRFIPAPRFQSDTPPGMDINTQHELIVQYTVEFLDGL